ncbi:hypothetical protein HYC85_008158 [Camellia sinensis]|uniref:Signal peptidase complex-like protein DTM1 n=1 Tax=Camellia sinensis TaxID=4442 RepID=A0A7J7HR09_CAMSI|nr:hypothetical protein HYC85_008158 [Camellia sinensis]
MANDAAFRSCLVWLAVIVAVVGLCTQSLRKMMATYLLGMFAVAGVLLPDWEFFDRHVSRWSSPVSFHDMRQQQPHSASAQRVPTTLPPTRSRMYPVRVMVYTAVYGIAFYKWWMFMSN